jgi:4-amino-4-deoxy-L-arabinose transferase-like glycosyltransferase
MIIKFFRKNILEIGIVLIFIASRVINLGIIPIFTDEAIYSYWAQIALHDPANRYISLEDGKQPLFIWFSSIAQLVIHDPLIAGRVISIFSGFTALIFIYLIAKQFFGRKTALFAAFLYVVLPITLLYDRLGLYDSFLTAICLICVYLSIKLAQKPKLDTSLLTGAALGMGLITKSSALLFLILLPAPLVILYLKRKTWFKQTITWIPFALLSVFIAEIIYNSLRLSQLFYLISRKNYSFIRPVGEVFKSPFLLLSSNATSIINWINSYIGVPLFIVFLLAIIYGIYTKNRKVLLLTIYVVFPFLIEILFNIVLYPRFVLFYFPYMIILIAFTFARLEKSKKINRLVFSLIFILSVLYPITNSFLLLTSPTQAKIASSDYDQYINSWPAGYGVKEVVKTLNEEAQTKPVYIGTEGTFGLLPFALNIYFHGRTNPQITGFWPVNQDNLPEQVLNASKTKKTFFLFNENQKDINNPKLHLVAKYPKGKSNSFMSLYEVR